ncbi:murein hydrolase activator EnvC family protein [Plantactinospora sp. DSM 117369]
MVSIAGPASATVTTVSTPSPAWARSRIPTSSVPRWSAPVPGRFRWPLDGVPRVVRRFDPPPQPWAAGHRGVDLAAPPGATVRAAGSGVVFFAGMVAGRPLVSVAHPNGLRTTYEPVRSGLAAGDAVRAGDPLGVLLPGHPGCAAAGSACLHWGLRRGDDYLDPLLLLGLGRVRLLPVPVHRHRPG